MCISIVFWDLIFNLKQVEILFFLFVCLFVFSSVKTLSWWGAVNSLPVGLQNVIFELSFEGEMI